MPSNDIIDRYGFKQTGSTTAVLVDLTNRISAKSEENNYVSCLLIDFTKAFDSVDHRILIGKLKNLNIADHIMRWMVALLTDRNQFAKIGEKWSFTKTINCSIVQGSGIEPTLFIICITDLKPIGSTNYITKYADDSSLLVPEKYDVDLSEEL